MDLVNYGERAWCRLEAYSYGCVAEILMKPVLFLGYGLMPKEKTVGCLPCFRSVKQLPPERELKELINDNSDLVNVDEMQNSVRPQSPTSRLHPRASIAAVVFRLKPALRLPPSMHPRPCVLTCATFPHTAVEC